MLLSMDTSTRYAGIALSDQERVLSSRTWYSTSSHTAQLMPAISAVLTEHSMTPRDLDGIAVALGPGGFSALRVGISAAKAMALASGKPVVGVGTLDLEAFPYLGAGVPVCSLLDSGRKEVASAYFGRDGVRTRPDTICPPDELLSEIGERTIICGEGVASWGDFFRENLGWSVMIVSPAPSARLWALAEMGRKRLKAGQHDDLVSLQPYYLRMPSIGGPKRRDLLPQQS